MKIEWKEYDAGSEPDDLDICLVEIGNSVTKKPACELFES